MIHVEATPLDPDAARQLVDAVACFDAWEAAVEQAAPYAGGMVWKRVKGNDYLVRTSPKGAQTSLGPRCEATETEFATFFPAREAARGRLATLRATLERHRRMNRALRVGRVPTAIVALHAAIRAQGLGERVAEIGTTALYAYETAGGARFDSRLLVARGPRAPARASHATLAVDAAAMPDGAAALAARIDPSFESVGDRGRSLRNATGLIVDVVAAPGHRDAAADGWTAPARDLDWLARAPRLSEVVVGTSGQMARMQTVDPRALMLHLDWVGRSAEVDRWAAVWSIAVAEAIERFVETYMPNLRPLL